MNMRNKLAVGVALACVTLGASTAMAATNAEVLNAIDGGLANLAGQQSGDGSWNYNGYTQAGTAAAVFALVSQQDNWGSKASAYQTDVNNGISYLLNNATVTTVGSSGQSVSRQDGNSPCPGGAATCTGVYWTGNGEATYTTGLAAQAIGEYAAKMPTAVATTTGPLAGMTWQQIAQGITNTFAAGQTSSPTSGNRFGGWRYFPGTQDSDSSTTQWAVTAMIYDQSLGATTPQVVKNDLPQWYSQVQQASGEVCYQPGAGPCDHADTGGLLLGLKFLGATTSDSRVQAALNFLNTNWTQPTDGGWEGNFGSPYAMWAIYKGLETTIGLADTTTITNLLGCGQLDPGTACNWYQDYEQWLVANQNGDGSWDGTFYWTGLLATSFDLAVLSATQVPIPSPEPASAALLAFGAIGLASLRWRKAA
jgi:hypothetical protein